MLTKEYKQNARILLKGKWNTMSLITLVQSFLLGVISSTMVGEFIVAGPLTLGFTGCSLAIARNSDVQIENLFDGFNNFFKSMLLYIINGALIFLWSLLLFFPGIMKYYSYSMSFYILKDNPYIDVNDARKKSEQIMYGHRWELFCLHFSFIGWILLSILTFGILLYWIIPYIKVSEAEFYENIKSEPIIN